MPSSRADRESRIEKAIHEVQNGASVKAASRDHAIPQSTLRDRLNGSQPIHAAKKGAQKLSPAQEQQLIDWIINHEVAGTPPTRLELQSFAQLIVAKGSGHVHIGKHWVDRFIARHNNIKTKVGKVIVRRATGATTTTITEATQTKISQTPQSSSELHTQLDFLRRDLDGINRSFRTLASKAGQAIDQRNDLIAALQAKVDHLEAQLAAKEAAEPTATRHEERHFAPIEEE